MKRFTALAESWDSWASISPEDPAVAMALEGCSRELREAIKEEEKLLTSAETEPVLTGGTIALREQRDIVDGWAPAYDTTLALAEQLCETDFVPKDLRGKPGATLACILTGRELGIGPMASFRFVQMVEGSASLSAEYKRAAVLSAGHEFEILEWTSAACKVRGRRRGARQWTDAKYSLDDARKANLMRPRGSWFTRPRRMLLARASSDLCDAIFPDVTNGLPTTELVQDGQYVDGQLVEEMGDDTQAAAEGAAQDESRTVTRTRKPRGTGAKTSRSRRPTAPPPEDNADEEIFDAEVVGEPDPEQERMEEEQAAAEEPLPGEVEDMDQELADDPLADETPAGSAPDEPAGPQSLRRLGILFREVGLRTGAEKLGLAAEVTGHKYQPGEPMSAEHALAIIGVLQLATKKDNPKAAVMKLAATAAKDRAESEKDGK